MNIRQPLNYLSHPHQYFPILLFILLSLFHIKYGIIPAWNNINSDFPNYYSASKLFIEGKDLSNIYDDSWFQQKINDYGIREKGKFSPFPPPTVFVMLPGAFFNPLTAKRIFLVLNLIVLLFTAYLFARISKLKIIVCLNFILFSGAALVNNLLLGQLYLFLLMFIVLGYWLLEKRKEQFAGLFWGIGAAVKYFPLVFIPLLFYNKKWKILVSLLLTLILINTVSYFILGPEIYRQFIDKVLFSHLNGELSSQSNYAVQFQSWNSLFRNLFVYDMAENKTPFINSPALFNIARVIVYLSFTIITVLVSIKIKNDKNSFAKSIALSSLLLLVLSPASASYHLLILAFPAMLLITSSLNEDYPASSLTFIILFILVGSAPFLLPKLGIGSLILLFYRLWLTVAYFTAAVWYLLISNRMERLKRV
ncbi:MAG: glycosyltransferase family 87 protein [Ignavibacteriales bacterium]|nr:glycosyltransferase family 87 protein [Ignavibacteriales bacterium]